METEVRISEQIPIGESTGVDVPGQLWKRYHMEKASIEANLNTTVEMGMSHTEGTSQNLFTYFAGGLVGIWLPRHNLTTEPFSAEKYYRDSEGMACMEIWVKPLPLENKC